jgi:peptide/nickel transport system permease protein
MMSTLPHRLAKSITFMVGAGLLLAMLAMALLGPWLYPQGPWTVVGVPMIWPGTDAAWPLGTDALGRDILAGLLHGARVSLLIGAAATTVALCVGIAVGTLTGYFGGWVDDLLMRLTDAVQTVPPFLLVIVVVLIVNPSVVSIVGAIALISWPTVARLVRAEFMRLRETDFVSVCRLMGMKPARIIFLQMLPNAIPPIVVSSSIMVASAILIESGLAFLGLGDPNVISWGTMVGLGRSDLRAGWYLVVIPGLAIMLSVLALNLLGDGLNDALNTRLSP